MKKILSLLAAVIICASAITGCTENEPSSSESERRFGMTSEISEDSSSRAVTSEPDSEPEPDSVADSSVPDTSSSKPDDPEPDPESSGITPAMWELSDDEGHTMTLVGSMHALNDDDYPLPQEIMKRYEAADILAVECDISTEESLNLSLALASDMAYNDGTTLKDHISEEGYEALSEYLKDAGYDIDALKKFKSWMINSLLEDSYMKKTDLDSDKGFDIYLLELSNDNGKEIYEVESVEFQIDLLVGLSDEIYDLIFRSLEGYTPDMAAEELNAMHEAWRTGDLDSIEESNEGTGEELSDEDMAIAEEYNRLLLYDRNKGMAKAAEKLLKDGKKVFFVVGAAHYPGEKGILSLLEKDGYKIERIEY